MTVPAGIEISPNSRFRLSAVPELAPGHCVVCNASDSDRQYIDFGFSLDFYGVIYFCSHCIVELAEVTGFISIAKLNEVQEKLTQLIETNSSLEKEYGGFRDATRIILRDCNCVPRPDADVLPVGDSPALESSGKSRKQPAKKPSVDDESGSS